MSTIFPRADYGVAAFLPLSPDILKPLDRLNRSTTRCCTGSFRTASLAALEKEVVMLPARLRIEQSALLNVTRYLTLPPTHGIHRHLRHALVSTPKDPRMPSLFHHLELIADMRWPEGVPKRRQRLRSRGVIREGVGEDVDGGGVDATLGMEPIRPVSQWAPTFAKIHQPAYGPEVGTVRDGVPFTGPVPPAKTGTVAIPSLEAAGQRSGGAIEAGNAHILCVVDTQATLHGILSTSPRSGQFRAIQYNQLVRAAQQHLPHISITNIWTPTHIGTIGNKLADEAVKAATEMEADPSAFVSLTTVQRSIRLLILDNREIPSRHRHDAPRLRLSPLYSSSSLARKTISAISRLCTGPSHLNAYCHKSGFTNSPACEACGEAFETRAHYLLQCPVLEPLRQPLHDTAMRAGLVGSLHVSTLLSEPKVLKALGTFIEASGRFER
ncbi:hypothetical protein B0H16DRAFT_1750515 [Mycena metata]|uniref:RNase H type-1 domain-containing protein n=1 Tax=Mycena metata TaxID=1033252 RepID=A0AAD7GI36_9AGAR|nr:hypothetical protein B0H16DRAFT_1750515 [Mycena metata]